MRQIVYSVRTKPHTSIVRGAPFKIEALDVQFANTAATPLEIALAYWQKCVVRWLLFALNRVASGLKFSNVTADIPVKKTEYRKVRIDGPSIMEQLHLSQSDIRYIYEREPKYIVVGSELAHRLLDERLEQMHAFPISFPIQWDGRPKILGMELVVVPKTPSR